ncbi:TerC family protein [Kurthia sp. Dielmo]|uniref:TerC family protein n=1 Tax=Kurthia sp. Dielmo TaxID=1033738 RepID=UPI0011226FD1|nr:TerC family protein [Kurthia sp. Dielmo]
MWLELFTNPVSWGLILTLILMEGLLSADNAIALAVQVKHLPEKQRKKALMYGLWGAYIFRFLAIGVGTILVKFWWIKVIGAAYLLFLAIKFFVQYFEMKKNEALVEEGQEVEEIKKISFLERYVGVFWATVISVELLDIAFSIDSVLATFGVSEQIRILLLGGMIGILMMRGVVQLFTKLMEKVPELEHTAYIIVGFIGVKMLLSVIHIEITHLWFFAFIVVSIVTTLFINRFKNKKIQQNSNL